MIVSQNSSLVLALLSALAVCGCEGDSTADESGSKKSTVPREMQRLLPKEVATLAKSVEAVGGRTMLRPESKLVMVRFEGDAFGDEQVAKLEQLEFATAFNAPGAKITDSGLKQLASAGERIETLDLTGNPITDTGLAHLERMPKLNFVALGKTQVTPAGVEKLQRARSQLKIGLLD